MDPLQPKTSSAEKFQFLSGGGEMAEIMRSKDWSTSLVGLPETWPSNLRTALSIILHSKFPMFLWWGADLICFYNDAYRPSLGENGKHPFILGEPAEKAWPEIWTIIKPLIDQVLAGGEATWSEDQLIPIYRNGKIEDVYWTFSYSPVIEDTGKVAGVLVTCSETTDKVITYKKLEESKNQLQFAIDAADMATWDINPLTNSFTGNDRLKEWHGLNPDEEFDLERGFEIVIEKDRNILKKAIARSLEFSSGGILDIEYTIINRVTKQMRIVRARGRTTFGNDKSATRLNGTLEDVTDEVVTRRKMNEGEQRFRSTVKQAPVGITILRGKQFIVEMANDAYLELVDRKENEFVNKPLFESLPEVQEVVHPLLDNVLTTGIPFNGIEYPIPVNRYGKQEISFFNFLYHPLKEEDGTISGIIVTVTDVSESVKAKEYLAESEKQYRQLADSLPELVWTTDSTGKQTFASRRWKDFTGLDPYDEKTFEKMVHPDDLNGLLKIWTHCLSTGAIYKTQVRLKSKEGDYQWFYVNGEPVKNNMGEIEKWIGAFTNINEQKKAEEELRNSFLKIKEDEERQNIIIEASELGTWELNLKTNEVKYSLRYLQIMGYKEMKHLTHEELLHHLHPDDLPVREKAFKRALQTGYLHYEGRLIWNDQTIHWMEVKGKVFYNDHNEPALLIGTLRDITEEKYYQQELQGREQKFRLLADSMPQFVWTGNAEGILSYFNASVYNYSGLTPEQVNKDGWLQIVHPDDQEENIKRWIHSVTTGTDFLFEHRFKRYDGEYRWQLSRAIPQRDAAGNIQMWVGSSTDIQEIKELDQQKDFFISMASHELKTPITSIKGYVQMLQSIYSKGEDIFLKNSLRVIDKQIVTLTNLISDLLDLSKIKSGSLFLNKEDFKINDLTREIIDEIEHVNPDYIFIFSGETEYTVHADRERIGQVLRNFLTNAVKYSPDFKTITIESRTDDADVIISVQDSGIGINKNDQEKIFERFYRVEGKNEKTFPGFGIGLFISSEIVSRHHGTIGVKSEPGKGSTFYFSIPLK